MNRLRAAILVPGLISGLFSGLGFADIAEHFPAENWLEASAEEVNLDQSKIDRLFDLSFADDATQGAAFFKDGRLITERYAEGFDKDSHGTSWSMAKSFYAALIGISIDRGEIASLDDPVANYLDYFNDERREITIRQILNMTSGLDFPSHEHEDMFFSSDHLAYARDVGVEKKAGQLFEYNNVNSMLLADILLQVTGVPADKLLADRIFNKIGLTDVVFWQDAAGNPLTYCCVDTTVRQYSRFGLLFARNGNWNGGNNAGYRGDYYGDGYCRRSSGGTGTVVGAIAGGVIGNQVARRNDRTVATVAGAVVGGLLGRSIDRGRTVCR